MVTVEDDVAVGDVAAVEAFAGEPGAFGAEVAFAGPAGPGVVAAGIDALLGAGDVVAPVGELAFGVLTADGADGDGIDADGDGADGDDAAEGVDAAAAVGTGTDASASPAPSEAASEPPAEDGSADGAASTPVNAGLLASLVRVVSAAVGVVLCLTRASSR